MRSATLNVSSAPSQKEATVADIELDNARIIFTTVRYSDPQMVLTGHDLEFYHEKKKEWDALKVARLK